MTKLPNHRRFKAHELLWLFLFVIAFYAIVPQIGKFHSSLWLIAHPKVAWLCLALFLSLLTYFAAAATYCLLAIKKVMFTQELIIQLGVTFINQLLPAGFGGLGANYEYLRYKHHDSIEAGSVVATNNFLGILGHAIILVTALLILPHSGLTPALHGTLKNISIFVGLFIVLAIIMVLIIGRRKLFILLKEFSQQISFYQRRYNQLAFSILCQMTITFCNVYCLSFSARAVGVHLSFIVIMLIFTFGSGVRNITPTPGGLGGFESSLLAGFVAYGIISSQALATVLLFRLISYWLPIVFGSFAFAYAEERGWFGI